MRKPGYLAALASSAVPGLDPVAVRAARGLPGNRCDVAFVTDTQRRAWVVRVPTTPAVGAQLDTSVPLLGLISRRLPFQVPSPRGLVGVAEGRAMVYPFLHGRSVILDQTPPGPGVAAELGRALAALHNVDRAVFEEAGLPVYDAETYRRRHLADLDRAAATGHVPTSLLSRWERALEDVSAWRFAPTPVHGDLGGGRVLVSFTDDEDSGTASVRAITGWEHAQVADPADDFAAVADECSSEAFESVLEAYAVARIERPDRHLRLRARLAAELRALRRLLDAVAAAEPLLITRRASELRDLDERTADQPDLVPPPPVEPDPPRTPVVLARSPGDGTGSDAAADDDADIDPLRATADPQEPGPEPTVGADDAADAPDDEATADASGDDADADSDERDTSQDTQRLLFGDAAEATTVIPADELSRLRADLAAGGPAVAGGSDHSGGETQDDASVVEETEDTDGTEDTEDTEGSTAEATVVEVEVERTTAPDESWYQVIEPLAPDAANTPDDPDRPGTGDHPAGSERAHDVQPTVVLVESTPSPDQSTGDATRDATTAPLAEPAGEPGVGTTARTGSHASDPAPEADVRPDEPHEPIDGDDPTPATPPAPTSGPRRRHRRATRP